MNYQLQYQQSKSERNTANSSGFIIQARYSTKKFKQSNTFIIIILALQHMSNASKRTKYSEFIKLKPQERLIQSEYFRKNKPDYIPVVVFTRNNLMPELPNCKFLMTKNKQLFVELNSIKQYILKNRNKELSESQAIFFGHNRKLLNGNIKVVDFVSKQFKDVQKDGWIHLEYGKQDIYG